MTVSLVDRPHHSGKRAKPTYLPFAEARALARSMQLADSSAYHAWARSADFPPGMAPNPNVHYNKTREWKGWADFLGTGRVNGAAVADFLQARTELRALGFGSIEEYQSWAASSRRPSHIPPDLLPYESHPDWRGTAEFLNLPTWRSFQSARSHMLTLGLRTIGDFRRWASSQFRPRSFPPDPERVYAREWKGWHDFLNVPTELPIDGPATVWLPFARARQRARARKFRDMSAYRTWWHQEQGWQLGMPLAPEVIYAGDGWNGVDDWLATIKMWTPARSRSFLLSLRCNAHVLSEAERVMIIQAIHGGAPFAKMAGFTSGELASRLVGSSEMEETLLQAAEAYAQAVGGDTAIIEEAGELDGERPSSPQDTEEQTSPGEQIDQDVLLPRPLSQQTTFDDRSLHVVDALIADGAVFDDEILDYLVARRIAMLWQLTAEERIEERERALSAGGGEYFFRIRYEFAAQLESVVRLPIPRTWSFTDREGVPIEPRIMQRHVAWLVRERRRLLNLSEPGTGKTLAALLASVVIKSRLTLVVTNHATLEGWAEQAKAAFPHLAVVDDLSALAETTSPPQDRPMLVIVNYDQFQTAQGEDRARLLASLPVEMIVLDEIQYMKARGSEDVSNRHQVLTWLIEQVSARNPEIAILGLTATPVINDLSEARCLLEVVTRNSWDRLSTRATIGNALAMHRALVANSVRYRLTISGEWTTYPIEAVRNDLIPAARAADNRPLAVEQVLLQAKLELVEAHLRRGTIIYTHYVDGIIEPVRAFLRARGYTVSVFTGTDKSGVQEFKEGKSDILLGSRPVAVGIDGLQYHADQIIALSVPDTGAAYEQLVGRLRRPGTTTLTGKVIIPLIAIKTARLLWAWDQRRLARIVYKRTLADATVDGTVNWSEPAAREELDALTEDGLDRMMDRQQRAA